MFQNFFQQLENKFGWTLQNLKNRRVHLKIKKHLERLRSIHLIESVLPKDFAANLNSLSQDSENCQKQQQPGTIK